MNGAVLILILFLFVEMVISDHEYLMIVGGYLKSDKVMTSNVEIIAMPDSDETCIHSFPNFPLERAGGFATKFREGPMFCAGFDKLEGDLDSCYELDLDTQTWAEYGTPLISARGYPGVAPLIDQRIWITGGAVGTKIVSTTEILRPDGTIEAGEALVPGTLAAHCLVKYNHTHLFLAGGIDNRMSVSNKVYAIDISVQPFEWTRLPDMTSKRGHHSCSVLRATEEVVVVGNWIPEDNTVEIFNFQDLQWRRGPDIDIAYHQAIPYHETFVIIGGLQSSNMDNYYDKILKYNVMQSAWEELNARLRYEGRMSFDVIGISKGILNCSSTNSDL